MILGRVLSKDDSKLSSSVDILVSGNSSFETIRPAKFRNAASVVTG